MKQRISLILIVFVLSIFLSFSVSAGFFDWFHQSITGKSTSQATNVSVSLAGISPVIIYQVTNYSISPTNANESGTRNITFGVYISDADGAADVNDTSVFVNFSRTGQPTRVAGSYCSPGPDLSATQANYSCSIEMWYWDQPGLWTIRVKATSFGNNSEVFNVTEVFLYNELKALTLSPYALEWGGLNTGSKNQTSSNDPQYVNNTGNYNGTIGITGKNLLGESNSAWTIAAGNFTVNLSTSAQGVDECQKGASDANVLTNGTSLTVPSSYSNPGNLSINDGTGQEAFYYCIPLVPSIMSQIYSTKEGSWIIGY